MKNFISRLARLSAAGVWAVLVGGAAPEDVAAQVLRGVVRDSTTGAPIQDVSVAQVRSNEIVARVPTAVTGEFNLPLQGAAPFEIRLEHLAYATRTLVLETVPEDEVALALAPRGTAHAELPVEARREGLAFFWKRLLMTERGAFWNGEFHRGCQFLVMDSVVLRDPSLFRPEMRRYWPASLWFRFEEPILVMGMRRLVLTVPRLRASRPPPPINPRDDRPGVSPAGPPGAGETLQWDNQDIADPRLRRDAWPCGVTVMVRGGDGDFMDNPSLPHVPRRGSPPEDAPRYGVEPVDALNFTPGESGLTPGRIAVSAGGAVAVALREAPLVQVVSAGGDSTYVVDFRGAPAALTGVTHLGWLADTLWATDASSRRVAFRAPDGAVQVRTPFIRPLTPFHVVGAATDYGDPDLDAPRPVAEGRWLTVQRAPPAPYPPRLENEPARRALVLLGPDGDMERVTALLRPGAWRVGVRMENPPVEPFADHPLYDVDPNGRYVTIVERALELAVWTDTYRVTRLSTAGDTIFHVERKPPLIQITDEAASRAATRLAQHPDIVAGLPDAAARRLLVERLLYRPKYHPPITAAHVGMDGAVWLRWPEETTDTTVRWDVLDGFGKPLRTLRLPAAAVFVAADDEDLWVRVSGETGEALQRYRLRPESPE